MDKCVDTDAAVHDHDLNRRKEKTAARRLRLGRRTAHLSGSLGNGFNAGPVCAPDLARQDRRRFAIAPLLSARSCTGAPCGHTAPLGAPEALQATINSS